MCFSSGGRWGINPRGLTIHAENTDGTKRHHISRLTEYHSIGMTQVDTRGYTKPPSSRCRSKEEAQVPTLVPARCAFLKVARKWGQGVGNDGRATEFIRERAQIDSGRAHTRLCKGIQPRIDLRQGLRNYAGGSLEVTKAIVYKALDLVGTVDKIPKNNATRLLVIVGNAAKGHGEYPSSSAWHHTIFA